MTESPARELQTITISPANATANGSAVQFIATGHWSQAPRTVTPQSATWGVCTTGTSAAPTTDVTVSPAGLATCANAIRGTFSVFAEAPPVQQGPVCNAIIACGGGCLVAGHAQLTCP